MSQPSYAGAVSTGDGVKRAFAARLFESPAIKSWKEDEAKALRRALSTAVEAMRNGVPLVIDLLVDIEAEMVEPLVEASKVQHWRSRPSQDFGAKVRRLLGFYSGESTLAAAVIIEDGAHLESLLRSTVLWDCEFTIYPLPTQSLAELPDPHFDGALFAKHVAWAVMQDSGSPSWLVTGLGNEGVDMVCATLTRTFEMQSLPSSTAPAPVF